MVLALLAVLGVDLILVVVLLLVVLTRRRWISRQPGVFKGAIRVVDGQVRGLSAKWRRGYGYWVRDVLVWRKAPFLYRGDFVPADALTGADRAAEPGEVRRLGKRVVVTSVEVEGGARIEVATSADKRERVHGPFVVPGR